MATDRKGAGAQQPFGPFVLERRIAVGGSAEVFLARPKLGIHPASRLVVKKLLRAAREGSDFDALEREAELHRAVVHRNVVNVFGAGMVGDEPYLAMEYVEGVDLYRLLRRAESEPRKFPPGLAAFIAMRVASALSAVHTAHDAEEMRCTSCTAMSRPRTFTCRSMARSSSAISALRASNSA